MDFNSFSRREFLKTTSTFAAFNLAMWMGGCESCSKQIANRPTRRNIANLATNDPVILAFKDAVQQMKNLPGTNPISWAAQAQTHFDHCPHQNWWWLPWHRAYLFYFERICRKLSGHSDFALPYWNWTTNPSIPAVYWGDGNPLFDNTRFATPASVAPPSVVGAPVIENILSLTNFFDFASYPATAQRQRTTFGMLEGNPHNNIHPFVGGDMSGFHSPLDAVFWGHHNILDCLWADWNINRKNANTNDPNWGNLHFTEFVDENGAATDVIAAVTVLYPILSYQFEPCSPMQGAGQGARTKFDAKAMEQFLRAGAPVKFEIVRRIELQSAIATEVGKPVHSAAKVEAEVFRGALEAGGKNAVLLSVDGVDAPDKADYYVRVFLGKPDAAAETPISDPHFAGSFGFFQDAKAMPNMPMHEKLGYLIDVTPTLRQLSGAGSLSGSQVDLSLVTVPYEGREAKAVGQRLSIEKLALSVAQVR
jgi:tyrosinase